MGERGVSQSVTKYHMGGGMVGKNVTCKVLLVISLAKVDKNLCHVTQGGRGESKCHQISHRGRGGLKSVEKVSRII